jgi:tRNA (mo5U34)-methyltransferase
LRFEAERRGAAEVLAIDCNPATIRRFNICRAALGSRAMAVMTSIYDLSPRTFGIFDVVLFYGVLYHLRHPLLALEKVASVCGGKLLMQTANFEDEKFGDISAAKFYPRGLPSGPAEKPIFDPTVFWIPNAACIRGMLEHVGFCDIELISMAAGAVFGAQSANQTIGRPPDETTAPWS